MCNFFEDIARYFLFVTNLLLFLLSCIVMGLSIWILVDQPSFLNVLGQANVEFPIYTSAAIILLVASILVMLVTFFGCCGAAKENRCLLGTYFVFVLLLLIGLAIGAFLSFSGDMQKLEQPFIESLKLYNDGSSLNTDKALVEAWNNFQQDFQCCGVDSWSDWSVYNPNFRPSVVPIFSFRPTDSYQKSSASNGGSYREPQPSGSRVVPESCCDPNLNPKLCSTSGSSIHGLRATGCFKKVLNEINLHSGVIGGVAIGVVVLMVLNGLISLYMCTCGYYSDDRPTRKSYGRAATKE